MRAPRSRPRAFPATADLPALPRRVISIIESVSLEGSMQFTANRRALLVGLSSTLIGISLDPVFAAGKSKMKFDTDNDGTLDLNEVKAAAGAAFDKLDRDSDGTLDKKELRGRISNDMMADADPDRDGTISKDEYVGLAEKLFKEADADGEGTLDAKELRSKAGRQLTKLLR
jgi:Ca2+-binding EF-hand superfamily protein